MRIRSCKKRIRQIFTGLTALMIIMLTSCSHKDADGTDRYRIYYPDKQYASIKSEERKIVSDNSDDLTKLLLESLETKPSDSDGTAAISGDILPEGYTHEDQKVIIDFPEAYLDMDRTAEILVRASIVETLAQSPDVRTVVFRIGGEELIDSTGNPVGEMTMDSFINNTGEELNSYERSNVTLYFTDINGKTLKRYDEDVVYNTNIAMEKFALETLIAGPLNVNEQDAFPTLSPDARLLSVTIKDRIAYANFDASVREEPYNVDEDVALYSIVNTLTALPGIDQVQISIEGSTEGYFMDHMNLDELYERSDELIQ